MALDKVNVAFMLGMVGFVAALGLLMIIVGGIPWWIAMGPAAVFALVVGAGLYAAARGWGGSRHDLPRRFPGSGTGWTGGGGSSRIVDDGDD